MSASLSFVLAAYFTFSVVIAFYAFKHFRKSNGITFAIVSAFTLLLFWWVVAVRWLIHMVKREHNVKNN